MSFKTGVVKVASLLIKAFFWKLQDIESALVMFKIYGNILISCLLFELETLLLVFLVLLSPVSFVSLSTLSSVLGATIYEQFMLPSFSAQSTVIVLILEILSRAFKLFFLLFSLGLRGVSLEISFESTLIVYRLTFSFSKKPGMAVGICRFVVLNSSTQAFVLFRLGSTISGGLVSAWAAFWLLFSCFLRE